MIQEKNYGKAEDHADRRQENHTHSVREISE